MEFLYFLQSIRNPVCDFLFDLITKLGEETVFLAVAILFFWCVNKREGFYILLTGLFGTVVNQGLKISCRIERPWIQDPSFPIIESARAEATGYSFPSGHTQNVAGTFGAIGKWSARRWVKILTVVIIILVAFSRMYLGVHTPFDVVVSLGFAAFLVLILHPFFADEDRFNRSFPIIVGIAALISLALLVYVNLLPDSIDGVEQIYIDSYELNIASARKNAATLFGCMLGLVVVYPIDRMFIRFKTDAPWYSQVIKLVLGLGIVILIKSVLQAPLEAVIGIFTDSPEYIARAIRYFIIVAFAGGIWPLTFSFFSKLRIKPLDDFAVWLKSKLTRNGEKVDTPATVEEEK